MADKGSYMSRRGAILDDRSASYWLKGAMMALEARDPADALADAGCLLDMAKLRVETACRTIGTLDEIGAGA
jgi:hypothetical protein